MDRFSGTGYVTVGGIRQFIDLNLATSTAGSNPNALWFNGAQESILSAVTDIGLVPTDADNTQLRQAMKLYAGANLATITATPGGPLTATQAGVIQVNAAAGNISITLPTGAAGGGNSLQFTFIRIDASSGNTVNLLLEAGDAALISGATTFGLVPGQIITLRSNGSTGWIVTPSRVRLTSPLTLYLAASGASDANNGLSYAAPLATLDGAWAVLSKNYDLNGQNVTIQCSNGTYTATSTFQGQLVGQNSGPGQVTVLGNPGTPASVVLTSSVGNTLTVTFDAQVTVNAVTIESAAGFGLVSDAAVIQIGPQTVLGPCAAGHVLSQAQGNVFASSGYTIFGNAPTHWEAAGGIFSISGPITLSGTPAFSSAFALSQTLGNVQCYGATFSGAATGQRYLCSAGGVVNTNGGGASFLPGSIAGSTGTAPNLGFYL